MLHYTDYNNTLLTFPIKTTAFIQCHVVLEHKKLHFCESMGTLLYPVINIDLEAQNLMDNF